MRYIYPDRRKIDNEWIRVAEALTADIQAAPDAAARKKIIDDNSRHWGKVKDALLEMSANKCWYTEADDCVAHWQVEHFRPKNDYPWLAFDWTNYRLSGAKPNGKKSTKFPLFDEAVRASNENRDCTREAPVFLDPTSPEDMELVTFSDEGLFECATPGDANAVKRVTATRDALGLDTNEVLVKKRREVWHECQTAIEEIRAYLKKKHNHVDALLSQTVVSRATKVKSLSDPQSPFSRVAERCIEAMAAGFVRSIPTDGTA